MTVLVDSELPCLSGSDCWLGYRFQEVWRLKRVLAGHLWEHRYRASHPRQIGPGQVWSGNLRATSNFIEKRAESLIHKFNSLSSVTSGDAGGRKLPKKC